MDCHFGSAATILGALPLNPAMVTRAGKAVIDGKRAKLGGEKVKLDGGATPQVGRLQKGMDQAAMACAIS